MPFDLSMPKLLVLAIIAMVVFGPDKLPQVARDAGRMLRQFRSFAQQARSDLKSELGDTVGDFDVRDLNPRTFVRKHLFDDDEPAAATAGVPAVDMRKPVVAMAAGAAMATGSIGSMPTPRVDATATDAPTPFDPDAT